MFVHRLRNVKGTVFVISMVISMLMILIAVSASNMLLQDVHMIKRLKRSAQAKYLAEAGLSEAFATLAASSTWSASSGSGTLGSGGYSYTISQVATRWLVISTGTVSGVSRTVSAEVKNLYPASMTNALAASNDIDIKSVQADVTIKGDLHANNSCMLREQGPSTLISVQAYGDATGKITACNTLLTSGNVSIADMANSGGGKPPQTLPSFDFGYFKSVAQSSGEYYSSDTTFDDQDHPLTGGTAGITFVNGTATFKGTNAITGGFVATNDIKLNNNNTITQVHDAGNRFPIFMCQNSMKLYGAFSSIEDNIVYAQNDVKIQTTGGTSSTVGTVLAGNSFTTNANNVLIFTYGAVVAPEVIPSGMEVVSWNR